MDKSCNNCFHREACIMADAETHIAGVDYDVGETCCEYVNADDVIVTTRKEDQFKHLTDEVFELYCSFQKSGFSEDVALILTKEYVGVSFERHADWLRNLTSKKIRR